MPHEGGASGCAGVGTQGPVPGVGQSLPCQDQAPKAHPDGTHTLLIKSTREGVLLLLIHLSHQSRVLPVQALTFSLSPLVRC